MAEDKIMIRTFENQVLKTVNKMFLTSLSVAYFWHCCSGL